MFGVALSMVMNEIRINFHLSDELENIFHMYVLVSSLVLVASIYLRYQLYLKWQIYRGLLTEFDTL